MLLLYLRSPIDLIPDRIGALGLLDDLVVLLVTVAWLRAKMRTASPGGGERTHGSAEKARAGTPDPHAVLGVSRNASPREITRAYHEQLKRYHPDRVAGLGDELQRVAHRKTIEIQRAYEALGKR